MPRLPGLPRLTKVVSGHRFLAASGAVVGASVAGGLIGRLVGAPRAEPEPWTQDVRGERRMIRGPKGSRIFTERFPGRDETLLFVHGWCLNESVWVHQKQRFGPGPLSVVTWDLPGHGRSSGPRTGPVSMELLVDALGRVVDETTASGSGVVLVAHSLGGVVALKYAAANPDTIRRRVRGLVLVSTPLMHLVRSASGGWPGSGAESWLLGTAMGLVVRSRGVDGVLGWEAARPGRDALSYRIVRTGFGDAPSPAHVRLVRDAIASVPRDIRNQTFRAMSEYDLSGSLAGIDVPAVVMLGSKDRLVNPADTRALAHGLPRATAVEYPGAGHAVFLERSESFNGALARFARNRLRRRRPVSEDT
jgi:pimeloyl-ACP methyl ester carboxylesterase